MNKVYEKMTLSLISTLMEDTPSKLHKQASRAGIEGFKVKPEHEEGITTGTKNIRVRRRKGQSSGSMLSKGGVKRLRRKLKSKVYFTPQEKGAIKNQLKKKEEEGRSRRDAKGKSDLFQDMFGGHTKPMKKQLDDLGDPQK